MSCFDELLQKSDETKEKVLKIYGVSNRELSNDVNMLTEWLRQTSHLPDDKCEERLEIFLIQNRMSMEKTKKALESYYSARTFISDFFENLTPSSSAFLNSKRHTHVVPMPDLTEDFSRIVIHQLSDTSSDNFCPIESTAILTMLWDLRLCHDYCLSDIYIFDLSNYTTSHLMKFTPQVIKKLRYIVNKSSVFHMSAIHLVNAPLLIEKINSITKAILGAKRFKKILMHNSLDSLYKHIPKTYLPAELGGSCGNVSDNFSKWCKTIDESSQFFYDQQHMKSDESRRIGRCHEFEIFGTGSQGSFKRLNIE